MADIYYNCTCGVGNDRLVHQRGCSAEPIPDAWPLGVERRLHTVDPMRSGDGHPTSSFHVYFHRGFWDSLDDNEREQLAVYMEAFETFQEREKKYHSLWMQHGAADSHHHVTSKAARTQFYLEGVEDESDPIDLINYTVFLIRNVRAGRFTNTTDRPKRQVQALINSLEQLSEEELRDAVALLPRESQDKLRQFILRGEL